jgi:cellulose synthase/poly-beta-1,6-N-acetylglucosamine synthase-like glycosyltransferase
MSIGVIGVSTAEQGRHSSFWASFAGLYRPSDTYTVVASSSNIAENRNTVSQVAIDKQADWVLYLDDDHILPQDVLSRLLDCDQAVVSALYTQREPPFNPVLMQAELPQGGFSQKSLSPSDQGLIEVAAAGAGCLLVKRYVLDALEPPYWTLGQLNPATWGDDLHFCSRVRAAGFKIYCNLDISIGHSMTGVVWPCFDAKLGWTANFARDPQNPPIVAWGMPLPGDP